MRETADMMIHHQATAQNFAFSPKKPIAKKENKTILQLKTKIEKTILPWEQCLLLTEATIVRPRNEAIGKITQFFANPRQQRH